MTTSTDPYTESKARGAGLGWAWVSDQRCPRRLVGKHCKDVNCWCGTISSGDTVGTRMRHLNDHGNTWRDHQGVNFVLWEPYGADGDELAELVSIARQDGLQVRVVSSVWNPPHTVGIAFFCAVDLP